jgi:signal transduction histidine kinase
MRGFSTVLSLVVLSTAAALWGADSKPAKGTPAEAKALLARAVKAMEKDEAKALAAFNDVKGPYVDRDLYVFCFDANHKMTAHRDPSRLGTDVASLKDEDGKAFGAEIVAAGAKGEGTVEYKWLNPVSQKVEPKVSFVKKAGKQTCGVGAYK